VQWTEEEYGIALGIGGGKERIAALLTPELGSGGLSITRSTPTASWPRSPLGAEGPVLAPQPHELGPLIAREALRLAHIGLGLDDPATERFVTDAEIPRHLTRGVARHPGQAHGLGPEVRRVVLSLVACGLPSPELEAPTLRCPRNRVNSTRCENTIGRRFGPHPLRDDRPGDHFRAVTAFRRGRRPPGR
jgi:hypothetical protein